jgi:seryl-tRNA synthetase
VTGEDDLTNREIANALQEIKASIAELRVDQKGQRSEFVPREVWDEAWRGLTEWKSMIATDLVDVDASLTRHVREHDTAHSDIYKHVDARVDAERNARVSGQRWAIGVASSSVIGFLTVAAMLLSAHH